MTMISTTGTHSEEKDHHGGLLWQTGDLEIERRLLEEQQYLQDYGKDNYHRPDYLELSMCSCLSVLPD